MDKKKQNFNLEKARENIRKREQMRKQNLELKRKKAIADFEKILNFIIEKYNPVRIYQWGSLLEGEHFSDISDIDMAIEGLSNPTAGLEIIGEAERRTDFPVDIVEIERIHPAHAELIKKYGKLVYERK